MGDVKAKLEKFQNRLRNNKIPNTNINKDTSSQNVDHSQECKSRKKVKKDDSIAITKYKSNINLEVTYTHPHTHTHISFIFYYN